jgi:hypothetical protein
VWNKTAAIHSQKPRPRLFAMDNGGRVQRPSLACAFGLVCQNTNPNAPARAAYRTKPPPSTHKNHGRACSPVDNGVEVRRPSLACAFGLVFSLERASEGRVLNKTAVVHSRASAGARNG